MPLANRATIGNMSPEYGSTIAVFPIDDETIRYLRLTGRDPQQVALVEAYAKEQSLWHDPDAEPDYSERLELDSPPSSRRSPGPSGRRTGSRSRRQDELPTALRDYVQGDGTPSALDQGVAETFPASDAVSAVDDDLAGAPDQPLSPAAARDHMSDPVPVRLDGEERTIDHGAVVIASITSCTNTSNPTVMVGAALLAKKAVERGLERKPWVKTSLAPGSKVVMDYYERAGLIPYLEKLGFHLVGYGCTTCIGNLARSSPRSARGAGARPRRAVAVLSGNRNFEGRINPDVKMNYLASPPLCVAYALAGSMDVDLTSDPIGQASEGQDVFLADLWPSSQEVQEVIDGAVAAEMFTRGYADVFAGDQRWQELPTPEGDTFAWDEDSTYVRKPPYFDGMSAEPQPVTDISGARVLAMLGDSVTTDHISPAGSIKADSPAGWYLSEHGVERRDFNSYGSRRGNHEVMIRGTFANIRLRNQLAPGTEGGLTRDLTRDGGPVTTIYEAAQHYAAAGTPLVVLAGKEYGSGSSRDWAAKGTALLGVRAVIAESYERIHRSNLIGMGVLPLQFPAGQDAASLGLSGEETFDITGVSAMNADETPRTVSVRAGDRQFEAVVRIDTPSEAAYYRHGGIMQYVLRSLLRAGAETPR